MKTKFSRIGKKSLSVAIAVLMVISTMLVGMVSVSATITGLDALYFTPNSNWKDANATFKLNTNTNSGWSMVDFKLIDSSGPVYKAELDSSKSYNDLQFLRFDSNGSSQWDYSKTFSWNENCNYYTITSNAWSDWSVDSSNGTWSNYTEQKNLTYTLYDYRSSRSLGNFKQSGQKYTLDVNLTSGTEYKLYIKDSDGGTYLDSDAKFSNQSVTLYKYGTVNWDHVISYTPSSSKHTFTWEPADGDKGKLSYTVTSSSYTITKDCDSNKGSVSGLAAQAESGTNVSFTVTPKTNYYISSVKVLRTSTSTTYKTLTISGNGTQTSSFSFEMPAYAVKVAVEFGTLTLGVSATVPQSVNSGEKFDIKVNASPDTKLASCASYYKYTVKAGNTVIANAVKSSSTTYTVSTSITADTTITYSVDAYNSYDTHIASSTTGSASVTVNKEEDLSVSLKASSSEISVGGKVTLTATASPSGTGYKYEFYQSTDGDAFTSLGTAATSNTKQVTCSSEGTYYFKVKVSKDSKSAESSAITVKVTKGQGVHTVKVWFKSSSGSVYVPSVSLDNGSFQTMNRDAKSSGSNGTYFGANLSGSVKFYWYYIDLSIDSSKTHTLTFRTKGTSVNAKSTASNFNSDEYYFAVDNLMQDTNLVDLTNQAEYIRNYHHTATHMVYSSLGDDNTLGFTYVDGSEYSMGSYITRDGSGTEGPSTISNLPFSVKSATLAQKITADIEETSELQKNLLDVNLDGRVDVRDATMMQKAIVGI